MYSKKMTLRVVIDYRRLNQHINLHSFTLPNISDILHSLGGATLFSTLDLKSTFHQIPLGETSKAYTAFSVGPVKYQYQVLSFRLSTSPNVYQSLMNLSDYLFSVT